MKTKNIIPFLASFSFFFSCNKVEKNVENSSEIHSVKKDNFSKKQDSVKNETATLEKFIKINGDIFPKTGEKYEDFVPKNFSLSYITEEGDLNNDGLPDLAIAVQKEKDSLSQPLLILLKQKNNHYLLDKISYKAVLPEYTQDADSESMSISKGILEIKNYGAMGAQGNIFYHYKYVGKELLLTYIETYDVGTGSWRSLYYDVLKGNIKEEITNTMEESMPSKIKSYKVKKQKYLFENASPDDIIIKATENQVADW